MSINKTEATHDHEIAYLVLSAPDDFVHDRLARGLFAAGGQLQRYGTGLKMPCRGIDWKSILRAASAPLSVTERHDIRVATVQSGKGPKALANAMFGSRRLDEWLDQLSAEWLHDILQRGAIAIHLQPLIQQPPGRLHGYECLVRGMDEAGALIPPATMFDAARHLGLLAALDETCRLTAIAHAAKLGVDAQLFVNFHPAAIYNPETCLRKTIAAIESAAFKPEQVTFEAAYHGVDQSHLDNIFRHVRSLGFKIAVDRVGPEDASASALAELHPDYLKFDGGFIRRAAGSVQANTSETSGQTMMERRILVEMTESARQQKIMTVACGIETDAEMKCAFDLGIRISQGIFHAAPQPEAMSSDGMKAIIERARSVYAAGKGSAAADSTKPWDISGLYQKLATLAHAPPRKSA